MLLKRIASSYASINNRTYNYALNIVKRRINFAIQKDLARQLTVSPNFSRSPLEDPYEAIYSSCFGVFLVFVLFYN
jgi:hypothetical protein